MERALEEFGQPEELRSELEATHGQRVLAVVIDKALQWKERTMKAKFRKAHAPVREAAKRAAA